MSLRKGKKKNVVIESKEYVIEAIRCNNDPRNKKSNELFINNMIIAYSKLFMAYAMHQGNKNAIYRRKKGKIEKRTINGKSEKIHKSLQELIDENMVLENGNYVLSPAMKKNIECFIVLRNIVQHAAFSNDILDVEIWGEKISFLQNYEKILYAMFDEKLDINIQLPLSTYFLKDTEIRKPFLGGEEKIINFLKDFRKGLDGSEDGEEYRFKLTLIPVGSNSKEEPSIRFVNPDDLPPEMIDVILEKQTPTIYRKSFIKTCKLKFVFSKAYEESNVKDSKVTKNHGIFVLNFAGIRDSQTNECNDFYVYYFEAHDQFSYYESTIELFKWILESFSYDEIVHSKLSSQELEKRTKEIKRQEVLQKGELT